MEKELEIHKDDLALIISYLENILLILKSQKKSINNDMADPSSAEGMEKIVEKLLVTTPVSSVVNVENSDPVSYPVSDMAVATEDVSETVEVAAVAAAVAEEAVAEEAVAEEAVAEEAEVPVEKDIIRPKKKSWFKLKLWRLAFAPNYPTSSVCEGNNRWRRVFPGFFWRYDKTGSGTRD